MQDQVPSGGAQTTPTQVPKRNRWRTPLGVLASVGWLALAWWVVRDYCPPKEWNAWGDFFAGLFAPLAFLWLVLGYMQQGEELRMQAAELRLSVEHQGAIARAAEKQLEHERAESQERARAERLRGMPNIRIVPGQVDSGGSGRTATLSLFNTGGDMRRMRWELPDALSTTGFPTFMLEGDDAKVKVLLRELAASGFEMTVRGESRAGERIALHAVMMPNESGGYEASHFDLAEEPPILSDPALGA